MTRTSIILICLLLFTFTSCEKWLDVNKDPNNPTDVDYELVLPSGITSVVYIMGGKYQVLGALWSQHWTQSPGASQYSGIDSYDINSSSFDDRQFGELYSGALKALQYVKEESEKEQEWNYFLIANVMQVYTFQLLADLYDEIPFSEALKGESGIANPHYEKGQDIYDSLIVRLDYALAKDFDKEGLKDPGNNDVLFNGNMDRWVEFANTLKLKLYLRQSEARPEVARAGIEKLFKDKVDFLSQSAVMSIFIDETGRRNPLYQTEIIFFGNNPNLILSYTLYSYLDEKVDYDRLNYMFNTPENGGEQKALEQGNYNDPDLSSGTNSADYSKPLMAANTPVYLMSLSESCFLQAEAMMRYNVGSYSDARKKYEEAVNSAYIRVLYPYLSLDRITEIVKNKHNQFPSEGSSLEIFIETIIMQKWVSLAGIQSLETFFEQNRTHYPEISDVPADDESYKPGKLTISVNNVTSNRFPKRLIFPASEYSSNINTPARKAVWEKVWWDTKP
jgi:hypothetical protein